MNDNLNKKQNALITKEKQLKTIHLGRLQILSDF